MLEKPCARPGCTTPIRKATPSRLRAAVYCSSSCAASHRVLIGNHPFHRRTKADMYNNAVLGGRTRGENARKRRYREIAALVDRHLPKRLDLDPRDLALLRVLMVRSYLRGYAAGYSNGHTKQRRETTSNDVAA